MKWFWRICPHEHRKRIDGMRCEPVVTGKGLPLYDGEDVYLLDKPNNTWHIAHYSCVRCGR